MNIFYLDNNTELCAKYHNNKHTIKMIVEYTQILSTNYRLIEGTKKEVLLPRKKKLFTGFYDRETGDPIIEMVDNWIPYQKYIVDTDVIDNDNKLQDRVLYLETHINHPSTVWARQTLENYKWLIDLGIKLCKEYSYRYGKIHKTQEILEYLYVNLPNIKSKGFTNPPPVMNEELIIKNNILLSYRNLYMTEKRNIAEWKKREEPFWFV